jgi:integrase/recombinase XerD
LINIQESNGGFSIGLERKVNEMKRKSMALVPEVESKTFDRGYDEFILNCKVRNLRPTTLKYYDDMVNIWYKCVPYKTAISQINEETVNKFIVFLRTEMNMNDVTVNTVVRGLKSVLNYFMKLGYMKEFKIPKLKEDRGVIETYSEEELKILLKKPNLKECSFIEYRNWVVINFFLATGSRARTLVNLKIKDLDFENELIVYLHSKNRRAQIVPMSRKLKQILTEYLSFRNGKEDDYVFVNAYAEPLKVDQLSHNMCEYNRKRGVVKTGLHRFRHTFAKLWILNNGDIFKLQKMLGHSTLDMVKNYVSIFSHDLQRDFDKFNPLDRLQEDKNHMKLR